MVGKRIAALLLAMGMVVTAAAGCGNAEGDMMIETSSLTKFGYAVPITAKEPEAAIKFLNLLYTSEDIMNALTWGVEGRDWVMGDDGYATFPEGVTTETVPYHQADFLYGNQFITTQWEGAVVTREAQKNATESAKRSKYFGFQISNDGLENTVTACYNVEQQYIATLMSGAAGNNWEQTLTDFQNSLKQAGIDDLISAYQEQLDAWLAFVCNQRWKYRTGGDMSEGKSSEGCNR